MFHFFCGQNFWISYYNFCFTVFMRTGSKSKSELLEKLYKHDSRFQLTLKLIFLLALRKFFSVDSAPGGKSLLSIAVDLVRGQKVF